MSTAKTLNQEAMLGTYLPNTGIQALQFLILGGHSGAGWLSREYAHKPRQQSMYQADNLQNKASRLSNSPNIYLHFYAQSFTVM
jgi:hypothetical protein